jgi:hypothetical protein
VARSKQRSHPASSAAKREATLHIRKQARMKVPAVLKIQSACAMGKGRMANGRVTMNSVG